MTIYEAEQQPYETLYWLFTVHVKDSAHLVSNSSSPFYPLHYIFLNILKISIQLLWLGLKAQQAQQ